ncbi:MarR family transcriptional regulator [Nocardia sp. NPDC046763]|uniref:MarR family winged helix-turn-helix transcriptional regulator n=1 Tax=Nocardia sp. NPDC046763 TaxID=3155256 RepID=UPI0033DB36FD
MTRQDANIRADIIAELLGAAPRAASDAALFQQALADRLGLNLTELKCLGPLAEGPATVGVIADRLGLTSGAVTRMVDKLERTGYVRREPDPRDGRKVLVIGAPERLQQVSEMYGGMANAWRELLVECSIEQLEFLRDLLIRMRDVTAVEITRLRG